MSDQINKKYWRIIDANYNRAKEGLRTVEDFLRFVYEDEQYTSYLKELRHNLRSILGNIESVKSMFSSRDSISDIGQNVDIHELKRTQQSDLILAAFGRVKEACRVLEETMKLINMKNIPSLKAIRYKVYNCEKEIVLNILSK